MATLFAKLAFDYRDLNFNSLIAGQTDFEFYDNINYTYNKILYQDIVYFEHDGGNVESYFGGTGFAFSSSMTTVTGGTITGYYEENRVSGNWVQAWGVEKFSYSAVQFAQATYTAGTQDDYAVVSAILSGNDTFSLSPYADRARGYGGNDQINGNAGADLLYGDGGADTLNGGSGADTLFGGSGNDTYAVDSSSDKVYETTTAGGSTDTGGTDTVRSGVSYVLGSFVEKLVLAGSNALNGTGNGLSNSLTGNAAANVLRGGDGNDALAGGSGADTLYGDAGNDLLRGGAGNDLLYGGAGNDIFRFDTALSTSTVKNDDSLRYFNPAQDTIQLENSIFTKFGTSTTGPISAAYFKANSTGLAQDSNDYLIYETDTGKLFYDTNGSAAGGSVQIALLDPNLALTSADYVLV